ncbi:MAG: sodium:proton antiporter NhaD [Flavobacteriales bacterium]
MQTAIVVIFILGYLLIAFEGSTRVNKAAAALITGVLCWVVCVFWEPAQLVNHALHDQLGEISAILFFLMGAMTIVELIDAHDGFEVITSRIRTKKRRTLLWIICLLAFFLSAVLDNLTTTIVMISLVRKLIDDKNDRLWFTGMIVIAANAGGAWSPIGDVTTTMLWQGNQITSGNIILKLFIPSFCCLLAPLVWLSFRMKGEVVMPQKKSAVLATTPTTESERNIVFIAGLLSLMFVPVFKSITGLPPYMGILFSLGVLWVITEIIHSKKNDEDKDVLTVVHALRKIDVPSILFFLGILLAVSVLQVTGILATAAEFLDEKVGNITSIGVLIGIISSVVDNVPLVAGAQGMYSLQQFPTDHYFWELLAYTAGTGGSLLIIGSAAGVAAMGMEHINFFWYVRKITVLALIGFAAGTAVYVLQHYLFFS